MKFPIAYDDILNRLENIDPVKYGKTRNFIDGAVTYLSPYISRGVISTRFVLERVLNKGYHPERIEKFIQELAWRDYWQHIWVANGDAIDQDFKHTQEDVQHFEMPLAVIEANTGIDSIDRSIEMFYETGYLHNHIRMYIASISCNIGKSHWATPAKWMYYHLLDADWASNALSWQWVAGSNSNKKYYANQDNINKYCYSRQKGTYLDTSYDQLRHMNVPGQLSKTSKPSLDLKLPPSSKFAFDLNKPAVIYNFYNLDPMWNNHMEANRILLLEPSVFSKYPVSQKTISFVLSLGQNIKGLEVYTGEFDELVHDHPFKKIHFKEHPLNTHYRGEMESRDWMFEVTGYQSSFFSFWKKHKKQIGRYSGLNE